MNNRDEDSAHSFAAACIEPLLGIIVGLVTLLMAAALLIFWLLNGLIYFPYYALFGIDHNVLVDILQVTAQRCRDNVVPDVNCALPGAALLAASGTLMLVVNVIVIAVMGLRLAWLRHRS